MAVMHASRTDQWIKPTFIQPVNNQLDDHQLKMLADMYEEEAENYMNDFTQVLNFIVLLMAVSLIAAVFIGTFLPIFLMGPKMMQSGI